MKSTKLKITALLVLLALYLGCESTGYPQGERIYKTYCTNCHMDDGTGLRRLIPPIAGADFLQMYDTKSLVCLILNGHEGGLVVNGILYNEPMPGFSNLQPAEVSNLVNYLRTGFGNALDPVNPQSISEAHESCLNRNK